MSGGAVGVADKALLLACSPLLSDAGCQASGESSPEAGPSTFKAEGSVTDGSQMSTVSGTCAHKTAKRACLPLCVSRLLIASSPALAPLSPSCLMDSHGPVHMSAGGVPLSVVIPAILALVSTWLPSYIVKSKRSFFVCGGQGARVAEGEGARVCVLASGILPGGFGACLSVNGLGGVRLQVVAIWLGSGGTFL